MRPFQFGPFACSCEGDRELHEVSHAKVGMSYREAINLKQGKVLRWRPLLEVVTLRPKSQTPKNPKPEVYNTQSNPRPGALAPNGNPYTFHLRLLL